MVDRRLFLPKERLVWVCGVARIGSADETSEDKFILLG